MPRVWGSWTATSSTGARFRLGMDWSRSGTRVTVNRYLFESAYAIYKTITLTRTGGLSGSYSVSVSTSGGVVSLGRGGSVTGSRGGSVRIGGRATNVLHGLTPSFSTSISIPAVAPSAPGRPSVSNISSNGWRTTWSSPSSTGGASISRYQVEIRNSSGTVVGTYNPGTSRSHTNSGRSANASYTVRVRARNSAGWGPWSSTRSVTTSALAPNSPYNVSASRNNDSNHRITWSQSITNARPVTSFRVQRRIFSQSGWGSWVNRTTGLSSSTRAWSDTGTRNNRVYQWRVVAVNGESTSTSSSSGSYWTTPWIPTNVSAQRISGDNIRLNWVDAVTYGSSQFEIERREDGGAWVPAATHSGGSYDTPQSWEHQNPDLAVTHQYRIRSQTTSGPTYSSDWITSNVVQLAAPPNPPTITGPQVAVDAQGRTVRLTWRDNPIDGSEQDSYRIRWRYEGETSWTTLAREYSSNKFHEFPPGFFANNTVIQVQVQTWGAHPESSDWSGQFTFRASDPPTVAINYPDPEFPEHFESHLTLQWGYDGSVAQSHWEAELVNPSTGNVVERRTGTGTASSVRFSRRLPDGSEWRVRVRVRDGDGLWSIWDELDFSVSYPLPPIPMGGGAWDSGNGSVTVDTEPGEPDEGQEPASQMALYRPRQGFFGDPLREILEAQDLVAEQDYPEDPTINLVTNPRGRAGTDQEGPDPDEARNNLLAAIAAYTDLPVEWNEDEPTSTEVIWVNPETGHTREWLPERARIENFITNPRGRTTSGRAWAQGYPILDPYFVEPDLTAIRLADSTGGWELVEDADTNYMRLTNEDGGILRFWPTSLGTGYPINFSRIPLTQVEFQFEYRVIGGTTNFRPQFYWSESSDELGTQYGWTGYTRDEEEWTTINISRGTGSSYNYELEYAYTRLQVMTLDPGAEIHIRLPSIRYVPLETPPDGGDGLIYQSLTTGPFIGGLTGPAPVGWGAADSVGVYYSETHDAVAFKYAGTSSVSTPTRVTQPPTTNLPATYLTEVVHATTTEPTMIEIGAQGVVPTASDPMELPAGGGTLRWDREEGINTGSNMRPIRFDSLEDAQGAVGHTFYVRALVSPELITEGYGDGDYPEWQWDGTEHNSPSHRPARAAGWYEVTDPGVRQASDEFSSLIPEGWGAGALYFPEYDAVYVPPGVLVPTEEFEDEATLILESVVTGEVTRYSVTYPVEVPMEHEAAVSLVAVVQGDYTGPPFDGDSETPGLTYRWLGDTDASASMVIASWVDLLNEYFEEFAVQVGPLVEPGTAITDYIPPLGVPVPYRIEAFTELGASQISDFFFVDTSPTDGWIHLNAGPGFSEHVRLRYNPGLDRERGRAKATHHFAGRELEAEVAGEARTLSGTLSTEIIVNRARYRDGMEPSSPEELEEFTDYAAPVCLRIPEPLNRWLYVSLGEVSVNQSEAPVAVVSVPWRSVSHDESVRLGVSTGDGDGDEQ